MTRSRKAGFRKVLVLGILPIAAVLALAGWHAPAARAAAAEKASATALDIVPDNAAFFHTMLRGREQWDAVATSRAWTKLKEMPLVRMGIGLYTMQTLNAESVPAQIERALKDPETRKLLDLGADMLSREVFVYGDKSIADFLELMQTVAGSTRYGGAVMQLAGEESDRDKARAKALIAALAEDASLIKVPEMVVGFKVTDTARAKAQLARLDKQAAALLEQEPKMQGRWKKATVAGNEYLTLKLDGRMLPWDELPMEEFKNMEVEEGDVNKIIDRLKALDLVVAIGLRGDYLLVSFGPSTDVLARLGKGKPLSSRPELAPLKKFADKRLTSISYASQAMVSRLAGTKKDLDDLRDTIQGLLPDMEVPKEMQDELRKDLGALAEDLKRAVPEPGANMAFTFLTAEGTEGYRYDWSEHPTIDASKPLDLLKHVGGSPMLAAVGRSKVSVEDYNLMSKWAGVAYRYVEKYALPEMPEGEREKFQKFMGEAAPLFKRLDETNRAMLLPALADGQIGLVMDARLTSKQFIEVMPPSDKALPMFEPALVFGVSDAALLRKAFVEYKAIADGLLEAAKKIEDSEIPAEIKIPDAKVVKSANGTLFTYPLPGAWGVDKQVLPNAGLADRVAVLSISKGHSERLLAAAPPTVDGRSLPTDRPLAGAAVFDINALLDALLPWVDYGFARAAEQQEVASLPVDMDSIRDQVHTVFDVLKVFRNVTSEVYVEGKAVVTHSRLEVRDVE